MPRRAPTSLLAMSCALVLLATGCGRLETLSTEQALERLTVATSKVYDAEGNVIANLHGEINRDILELEQIPKHVRDAVVAVEDERFWDHQGLDLRSIIRAALSNTREGSSGFQGGSTISQQLAKNLYFSCEPQEDGDCKPILPARDLSRKLAEARVTWQLERSYTKSEILEMYLNTIYLGRGTYGIETAAHSYFDKRASELTLAEAAFIVGLIHEPARYEWAPSDPPDRREARERSATARRNYAIDRMLKQRMISEAEADEAKTVPLEVQPAEEQRWKHPYFVDLILRQLGVLRNSRTQGLDPRFDFLGESFQERARNVYLRGLRIYTTLDPGAQGAAERAVKDVLPKDLGKMSAALASIEPTNGYIRALVGGRDYYPDCEDKDDQGTHRCRLAKVNLALGNYGGGSGRQPGSSFKPFVLAAALQRGVSLHQSYPSAPFEHPLEGSEPWRVRNYEGAGGGTMSLMQGTAKSVNAVFAHLEIDGVGDGDAFDGSARVAETARRLGIGFATPEELERRCGERFMKDNACIPADNVPAVALGAKEVSPLDMASAYGSFANDGIRVEPTAIVRIEDAEGRVLYRARPSRLVAVPPATARGVTHALKGVFTGGTGTRAALDRPAAGKTGTSQQWRDAWLAGYVPQLATVVWVGNPISLATGPESMIPSNGYPTRVTGGSIPAQIWHAYMTSALDGVPVRDFPDPPQAIFRGTGQPAPSPSPTPSGSPGETPEGAPSGVPSVVGMSFGQARNTIQSAGFEANVARGCDPSGDAGLHDVYAQSPEGGSEAPSGSTVTVFYQGGGCPD